MQTEIRIVIADDHPIFRKGLRSVIETDSVPSISSSANGVTVIVANACPSGIVTEPESDA